MVVQRGQHLSLRTYFLYERGVHTIGDPTGIANRMVRIATIFFAATETARDIAENFLTTTAGSLPHHPLEDLMLFSSI